MFSHQKYIKQICMKIYENKKHIQIIPR
jgi:hypothetical protein